MRAINVVPLAALAIYLGSFSSLALAEVKPAAIFHRHLVIQRDRPIKVWGTAAADEKVTVKLAEHSVNTIADSTGYWQVDLEKLAAGGPYTLTIIGDNNCCTIEDVLIGEVWLCAGQSNMHWTLAPENGVINNEVELANANYPQIRMLTVSKASSAQPLSEIQGSWLPITPKNIVSGGADGPSAVAYFFGRELQEQLKIPIGLIHSSVGGTPIKQWSLGGDLFNGMIYPLRKYRIRGAIWYQGENNCISKDGMSYFQKQKSLIETWWHLWNEENFPFYFVQLAPYRYSALYKIGTDELPQLWEAQLATLAVPNTGMVVTTDLVDNLDDCHPRNKQIVGKRLALWALNRDYGRSELVYSGPLYKSIKVEGNQIRLNFDSVGSGLTTKDGKAPTWFEIAGEDEKFVPAIARIEAENSVVVSSEEVRIPKGVRFAWNEIAEPNLINKEGLPASPFRTK